MVLLHRYTTLCVANIILLVINVFFLTRQGTIDDVTRSEEAIGERHIRRSLQAAGSVEALRAHPVVPNAADLPLHQPQGSHTGVPCNCPTDVHPTTPHIHSAIKNYHSWSLTLHTTSIKETLDESNGSLPKPRRKVNYDMLRKGYKVPKIENTNFVNCKKILEGDPKEIKRGLGIMEEQVKVPQYEEMYQKSFENCDEFKQTRGFITVPLTPEEEHYPLAFSIAMYKDVEQVERLLRAIYQPQNIYCIHIDIKSSVLIHRTLRSMTDCFDNVFVATHQDKVKWGDVSVLLPAINCMRDLAKYYRGKFKYYINLTGQEFPLRTNLELVRIAKLFNGSNDIAGSIKLMENDKDRVTHLWTHRWSRTYQQTIFFDTFNSKAPPADLNLTFYKGELHGLFSQRMVEYLVESKAALEYLKWCWDSGHPSEHYWNTLNYNKHLRAPGGYEGPIAEADEYATHVNVRAKHWIDMTYGSRECRGNVVRGICVYGLEDIPWLATRKELAANKFHMTFHYLGYDCLEERHRNRTMRIGELPEDFDEEHYRSLPTVRYSRKDGLYENIPIYKRGMQDFGHI